MQKDSNETCTAINILCLTGCNRYDMIVFFIVQSAELMRHFQHVMDVANSSGGHKTAAEISAALPVVEAWRELVGSYNDTDLDNHLQHAVQPATRHI